MPTHNPQAARTSMFQGLLLCFVGVLLYRGAATPLGVAIAAWCLGVGGGLRCAVGLFHYSRTTKTLLFVWSGFVAGFLVLAALAPLLGVPYPGEELPGGAREWFAEAFLFWPLVTGVIAIVAVGFGARGAATRGFTRVTDSTRRYEFVGYSVRPPAGENWFAAPVPGILRRLKMHADILFTKTAGPPSPARPRFLVDHLRRMLTRDPSTIFVEAGSGFADVPAESGADLLEHLARERSAEDKKALQSGGRIQPGQFRASPDTSLGTDCLWYDAASVDRGVPGHPGTAFDMSEHGVLCVHPDCRWFVISATYSRRAPQGTPHADAREEAEAFLRSLKFSRLEKPLPVAVIAVGSHPRAVAIGEDAVWVASVSGATVSRIDPETNEVVATIPVSKSPAGVAVTDGTVWVADPAAGAVSRIDSLTNRVVAAVPVAGQPFWIAADSTAVWLTHGAGAVSRIDARTAHVAATIPVGKSPASAIAVGEGFVWATSGKGGLVRIDPRTNRMVGPRIRVGKRAGFIAVGEGAVWVADPASSAVVRVDPGTCRVVTTIPVGSPPYMVAVGMGAVWTTNPDNRVISRIDPQTNRVVGTIPAAGRPLGIAIGKDAIWVGNGAGNTVQRLAL